jgi:hypothetical protein
MGWACSTCRGEVHTRVCWGDLEEGNHLEDPTVNGTIVLKWIFRNWGWGWGGGGVGSVD